MIRAKFPLVPMTSKQNSIFSDFWPVFIEKNTFHDGCGVAQVSNWRPMQVVLFECGPLFSSISLSVLPLSSSTNTRCTEIESFIFSETHKSSNFHFSTDLISACNGAAACRYHRFASLAHALDVGPQRIWPKLFPFSTETGEELIF